MSMLCQPAIPDRMAGSRFPAAASLRSMAAVLTLCCPLVCAASVTTIDWENQVGTGTPADAAIRDVDASTPVTAGAPGAGNGAVVALGYFTGAISGANFSGDWVPLTGPQAANIPYQRLTVGDAGSAGDMPAGFFTFSTDFDADRSEIYQRVPPIGTRLSVAFYNATTIAASTHFNIATHEDWQWQESTGPLPLPFLYINPALQSPIWFGGADTALRTAVPTASFPGNAARAPSRLINVSTRGFVGTGDAQLIPGFVLEGTGSTPVLVRAVGPTLAAAPYGVQGTLADPVLSLTRRWDGVVIGSNDDWNAQSDPATVAAAFATTGAFPLPSDSVDAALVATLAPSSGGYTVNVTGKAGATGVVIAEAYLIDASPVSTTQLVNVSTRGFVGTGDGIQIPGFVIGSGGPRRLLIRAVGPTLGAPSSQGGFGIGGTLGDPRIQVVSSGLMMAENDNWSDAGQAAALSAAAAQVGAFPLISGSRDAALLLDIPASQRDRAFTVQVSGANAATGLVITEIYELP